MLPLTKTRIVSALKVIPFSILLLSSSATASPVTQLMKTALDTINPTFGQADSLVSQVESTPPDVVVDTDSPGAPSPTSTSTSTRNTDTRFSCQTVNGEYTVVYHPQSQPNQSYPWAVPKQLGGGWNPLERCQEISRRLESYRPDGLVELTTSVENNYDVLCVTTEADPSCRIVLTVPPGQDPVVTRDRVFENLLTADSGQTTQGVNTFSGGDRNGQILDQLGQLINGSGKSDGINLQPFLAPEDGGTGPIKMNQSTPSNSQQLPDLFR